jgi:hypothetical protein
LDFVQAPADFIRIGVGLHCSDIQGKLLIFGKKHFWIRSASFFHGTLIIKAELRTAWRKQEFSGAVISCGSRIGHNLFKKNKKVQDLHMASFYVTWKREQNSNLGYGSFAEIPFTKMTYHVRGFMAFRSNELGFSADHGIFCRNVVLSYTRMSLGMERNTTESILSSSHEKCLLHFWNIEIGFFCEEATETRN